MIRKLKLFVMAVFAGIPKSAFADQSESKIKTCLTSIYIAQDYFHRANGRFSAAKEELTRISSCAGLNIIAEYADEREFSYIAKADSKALSINESKRIEEVTESDLN